MSNRRQERRAIEQKILKAARRGTASTPAAQMTRTSVQDIDASVLHDLLAAIPPSEPGKVVPLVISGASNRETVIVLRLADYAELLRRAGLMATAEGDEEAG